MKLHILTLLLDGMPFLKEHLPIYEKSGLELHWHIVQGVAANSGSTKWCKPIEPRFSRDGSNECVNSISGRNDVSVYNRQFWSGGKDSMICHPLSFIHSDCVILQADCDELWQPDQLRKIVSLFEQDPALDQMNFYCRYFVGPDIVLNLDNELRHKTHEWRRAWRWRRGFRFTAHEPPTVSPTPIKVMPALETHRLGLVFDHYAYATEAQVRFKEQFYGYKNAVPGWKRLQLNKRWPVKAQLFLPWANPFSIAEKISLGKT